MVVLWAVWEPVEPASISAILARRCCNTTYAECGVGLAASGDVLEPNMCSLDLYHISCINLLPSATQDSSIVHFCLSGIKSMAFWQLSQMREGKTAGTKQPFLRNLFKKIFDLFLDKHVLFGYGLLFHFWAELPFNDISQISLQGWVLSLIFRCDVSPCLVWMAFLQSKKLLYYCFRWNSCILLNVATILRSFSLTTSSLACFWAGLSF